MGKFYEMINDFHDSSKKWDPITHYTLDATHDLSTKSVGEMGRALGWDHLTNMANKDKADFGRWGGNTLGSAAAIYGGMSAYGAGGGGSGGWTAGDTGLLTHASDGAGGAGAAAGGGGGGWMKALSGGLRGGGNSMSQSAQARGSSYDNRTAEILAEILREKQQNQTPGWVNPNRAFGENE